MPQRYETYQEFWPFYLREHSKPQTRALHFVGTGLALLFLPALIVSGNLWWLLAAVTAGYFFAWVGHFTIEKNQPATFAYPLWSLISDFRMFFLWVAGSLDKELRKAGVDPR